MTVHDKPQWSTVFSLAFCVACLIALEFILISWLTRIAHDFQITEGMVGQSMSITVLSGLFSSLLIMKIIEQIDRKIILILFSALLIFSSLISARAPNFLWLET